MRGNPAKRRRGASGSRDRGSTRGALRHRALLGAIAVVLLLGGARAVLILVRGQRPAAVPPARPAADQAAGMSLAEAATEAAGRPRDRARVIVARAFFLRVWGFPMDAVAELHRAVATDPSYPDLSATARLMERTLRDPTLPLDTHAGPGPSN